MQKTIWTRLLSLALALVMLVSMAPSVAVTAKAATVNGSLGDLGVSYPDQYDNGTSVAGNAITVKVKAGGFSGRTMAVTLTNNKSEAAVLSFSYKVVSAKKFQIGNEAKTGEGTYSIELAAGANLKINVQSSGSSAAAVELTAIQLFVNSNVTTTFAAPVNGSYTVDGEEITQSKQFTRLSSNAYSLKATANEGYIFLGYYNQQTGECLGSEAEMDLISTHEQTVEARFISNEFALFETAGTKFADLNEAINHAQRKSANQITLVSSGAVPAGDYTIPAGITLLVPHDASNVVYTEAVTTGHTGVLILNAAVVPWSRPSAYKTLTLASGATLTVNGNICVGGKHSAQTGYSGSPTGAVGMIDMKEGSSIVLDSGANLFCWGFIYGKGKITANSGATVHENFQITDFRGGSATSGMANEFKVFPLSQYYVQNVEVPTTFHSGAKEKVWTSIFMSKNTFSAGVDFIGEGAMFVPGADSAITKSYDPAADRLHIEVQGSGAINSMALSLGGSNIASKEFPLPINSNISISIHSGTTTLNQTVALLPGVELTIDKDAELVVASGAPSQSEVYEGGENLFIYDVDEWSYGFNSDTEEWVNGTNYVYGNKKLIPVAYTPTRTYNRTAANLKDVVVNINGTLTTYGFAYTTAGGASVISSKGTGKVVLENGAGVDEMTVQAVQNDTAITYMGIPISSIWLKNADGTYTETAEAAAGTTFIYKNDKWMNAEDVPTEVTVTFYEFYGSGADSYTQKMVAGVSTALTTNTFAMPNYTFDGWADKDENKYTDGQEVTLTEDLALYAQWKKPTYTVTWTNNNGSTLATKQVEAGTKVAYDGSVPPTKESTVQNDYDWTGWFVYVDGEEESAGWISKYETYTVDADTVFHPSFEAVPVTYTILWYNGDVLLGETYEPYGGTPTYNGDTPTKVETEGYTYVFEGWMYNDEMLDEHTVVTGNMTFHAIFVEKAKTFTVTFDANGGEGKMDNQRFVYNVAQSLNANSFTREHYSFTGWNTKADGTGTSYVDRQSFDKLTADMTLYAQWKQNTYTVTFNANGGTGDMAAQTVNSGEATKLKENAFTREDYNFTGWNTQADGKGTAYADGAEITATANVTLYAQWQEITYTVTRHNHNRTESSDHTGCKTDTVKKGDTYYPKAIPSANEGKVFSYWRTADNSVVYADQKLDVTADMDLYAFYEDKYIRVIFDANGGTGSQKDVYIWYGTQVEVGSCTVEKVGYSFTGWNTEANGTGKTYNVGDVLDLPFGDGKVTEVTLYAQWANVTYTVTWKNWDGTVLETDEKVAYGAMPYFNKSNPTRQGDAQYSYTFAGWDKPIERVTADVIYTAIYTQTVNKYTVTWVNEGTVIASDVYEYGKMPIEPAAPTKPADAQYTYTFDGWDKEIVPVTGDTTYTATYYKDINSYTVTWMNGDVVLKTEEYSYGQIPYFKDDEPTKAETDEFTYTFAGWTPNVTTVTGNITYTAQFKATKKTYTITWMNGDAVIYSEKVPYGETPSYDSEKYDTPVKDADEANTYIFAGWDPEVTKVTGNATYTAKFETAAHLYTVKWVNGDEVMQEQKEYKYDPENLPVYDEEENGIPTKTADAQYTYTFSGWSGPVVDVKQNTITYTAQFSTTVNKYTVTWKNADGKTIMTDHVAYGEIPAYSGATPVKDDMTYSYTFTGWDPAIVAVTGNAIYTAQYSKEYKNYTVIWLDAQGQEIQKAENVHYDNLPTFAGEQPQKDSTAQYTYTFDRWEQAIANLTITFTPVYTETTRTYTVTWVDWNNETLETDENVPYGTMPSFGGETPTREATAEFTYTFTNWDKDVTAVTGDVTYKAVYSEVKNQYEVIWKDDAGNVLKKETVDYGTHPSYGDTPVKTGDAQYSYTFAGWDPAITTDTIVTGNVTYTAKFTQSVNSYTITWKNGETVICQDVLPYGTEIVFKDETPTKADEGFFSYSFTGWDPELTEGATVTGDATYTAQFTKTGYTGWHTDEIGTTYVIDGEKAYANQWATIDGDDYYFDGANYIVKGLFETDKDGVTALYVFDKENGKFLADQNGLYHDGGDTYWTENGAVVKDEGLVRVVKEDGEVNYYYFLESGKAFKPYTDAEGTVVNLCAIQKTNGYEQPQNGNYGFPVGQEFIVGEDGVLQHTGDTSKNGFVHESDGRIVNYVDGITVYRGLFKLGDDFYYIRYNGELVVGREYYTSRTNGLMKAANYRFDAEGKMIKDGFFEANGKLYYYQGGQIAKLGLFMVDGSYYYSRTTTGEIIRGCTYWITVTHDLMDEGSYEFAADGKMIIAQKPAVNGIVEEDGKLYYYENNKRVYKGLILLDGKYYYVRSNGELVTGRTYWTTRTNDLLPEGNYTFDANGQMIR